MADFCRQEALPVKPFYSWRGRTAASNTNNGKVRFLPVNTKPEMLKSDVPASTSSIKIEIGSAVGDRPWSLLGIATIIHVAVPM
ncbi:MAG: hypothetical protein R8J85_02870 [Mariprofundales bacterium]